MIESTFTYLVHPTKEILFNFQLKKKFYHNLKDYCHRNYENQFEKHKMCIMLSFSFSQEHLSKLTNEQIHIQTH